VACLLAGAVSAVLGAALGRDGAAVGALISTALVLVFFTAGALPVLLVGGDTSRAGLGFLILQMTYLLRLVLLLGVLGVAEASGAVDIPWLVGTLIVLTLVWTTTRVALLSRSPGPPVG
jgi:hypothetical protein